ncbi:MAG: membrane dipeptidase [Ferruginibacter sp.]
MNRSEFLNKLSIVCLSFSPFIKKIRIVDFNSPLPGKQTQLCPAAPSIPVPGTGYFIDMHCHPSLKLYLWGKRMWKQHPSKKGSNIFNLQVDVTKVIAGNVRGLLAAHYLPEKGLREELKIVRMLFPILKIFAPRFSNKIEEGNCTNFRQLSVMLDEFEQHVEIANKKMGIKKTGKDVIKIARSYREFEDNINAGIISIAQTIEGAHALGREMGNDPGESHLANLERLFERGICLITLAHWFQNDCCFPVEGMPPWNKAQLKFNWKYDPESDDKPLTAIGRSIVIRMMEIGMIVDITHLTPIARSEVFLINEKFNRPIVFSHAGVQSLFKGPKEFENFRFYCANDEEINNIKKCNGVIALIFMNYFLVGSDNHIKESNRKQMENGIGYIIETIQYIRKQTGTYENIALGSDFDNFGNSPADLKDSSYFPLLLERIKNIPFIREAEVDMITQGNVLRVLREGWKR